MRPLFFDFPDDPACCEVEDQFMFGPDILVAPVLQQGATEPQRLPAGRCGWADFWTMQVVPGGRWLEIPVDLKTLPLWVLLA